MNNVSKICFVIAALSGLVLGSVYFIVQVWLPILYFFLIVMMACVAIAVMLDWKLYFEFFTLRTTKHGMNMGVLIVLMLTGLVCLNYLGVRYNKTWDLTSEKLYSLSDQTKRIVSGLEAPAEIKVFFKGPAAQVEKAQIQRVTDLYKDYASSKVKIHFLNAYVDKGAALEYLSPLADRDVAKAFAFVEYKGKRIRVESPFDENQFTRAIVKSTRRGEKKVYFLKGHGERDIESDTPEGLRNFKEALEGQAFQVATLNLIEQDSIPKDADFLAIIGPKTPFLPKEIAKLKEYLEQGGRMMVAADPGERHNLAGFFRTYGIDFMNNYVVSLSRGVASTLAAATQFSPKSKITQDFMSGRGNLYAAFDQASELRPAPTVPNGVKLDEIVKTDQNSLAMNDIKKEIHREELANRRSFTLGIEASGRLDHNSDGTVTEKNNEKDKEFELVVFGDSDFIANQAILLGVNRDLALNTTADLAHESDLIGTRAKSYKGTVIDIGRYQWAGMFLGGLGLPIVLVIASGIMWFRRRGA